MQNKTIPLFAGSATELGAQNVTLGRDRFSVQLKKSIQMRIENLICYSLKQIV